MVFGQKKRAGLALLGLLATTGFAAAPKEPKGPVVELPPFIVLGTRIPASSLEISWECKGPMPIYRIKRAWISRVKADSPVAEAGFKTGDKLLSIGGREVGLMTGLSLQADLKREHALGTREEFVLQTPGEEKRTVVLVFEMP